ncbi:MAG: phosphatase PAP2 family protein [Bacteroidetes bacterium]|nr:MAG: phosphatase PAP2 family protein [Bacteroidota bacterium]
MTLKQIVLRHKYFYLLFGVFFLAGLGLAGYLGKGDEIRFFSEHRTAFGDAFFKLATHLGEEPAYYIIGGVFLFIRFRTALLIALTGLVVTAVSYGLKAVFLADRPFTFFDKQGIFDQINIVEGVRLLVGPTSFPSGHTMSGFALYLFVMFHLPPRKRWAFLFFTLAALVGVSRIYLVQHFLPDVLAGAFFGVLIGTFLFYFDQKFPTNPAYWIDRSFLNWKGTKPGRA